MKPLDESAHDVLQAGRAGEGPSAADRERVRGKLAIAIAAGAAGPAIAAPAMKAAAKWWASKTVIGLVSASVVAVSAAVVLTRPSKVQPVDPPPAVSPVTQPVVATAPVDDEEEDEVEAVDDTAPPGPSATPTSVPVKKVKRKKKPVVKEVKEVEAPPPISTPPPQVVEPSKRDDTLEAETQGLREVHAALRAKDSAKALSLIDEQDRRFPLGQLRPEREAAKVLALCASDPKSGGAALAQFVERHPGSPLLPRLRAACTK